MKRQSGRQTIIDQRQIQRGDSHRIPEEEYPEWVEFDKTPDFGTREERVESFMEAIARALGLKR